MTLIPFHIIWIGECFWLLRPPARRVSWLRRWCWYHFRGQSSFNVLPFWWTRSQFDVWLFVYIYIDGCNLVCCKIIASNQCGRYWPCLSKIKTSFVIVVIEIKSFLKAFALQNHNFSSFEHNQENITKTTQQSRVNVNHYKLEKPWNILPFGFENKPTWQFNTFNFEHIVNCAIGILLEIPRNRGNEFRIRNDAMFL